MKPASELITQQFLSLRNVSSEKALQLLMTHYGDTIYGVLGKILPKKELLEEAMQDGFVKIWRNLNDYQTEKGSLFTWLLTIFRNTAIDILRKETKRQIQSIDSSVYDSMKYSENTNVFDPALLEKIKLMDPKYRELVDLIYLQGFTQQEVSEQLNIPLGTVKTRISAGIKMLRDILNIIIISIFVHHS